MGLTTAPAAGTLGAVKSQTGALYVGGPDGSLRSAMMTPMTSPNVPDDLALSSLTGRTVTMEFTISDPRQLAILAGQFTTWHLALCHRCEPDYAQPFTDDTERDSWAVAHVTATGHVVQVTTETTWQWQNESGKFGAGDHETAMLRFEDPEGWGHLCTTKGCERWNGPYDSGQLALASFRGHTAKSAQR